VVVFILQGVPFLGAASAAWGLLHMTRHCPPVPARRQLSLLSIAAVLAWTLGLAGCLEPVSAPLVVVDAGDGSVVFVPDTFTPPKDVFLAELSGADGGDDAADGTPPTDADDDADTSADDAPDDTETADAGDAVDATDTGDATDSDTALPADASEATDASADADQDASADAGTGCHGGRGTGQQRRRCPRRCRCGRYHCGWWTDRYDDG